MQYLHALGNSRPTSVFDKWYGGYTVDTMFMYFSIVALFGLHCVDVFTFRKFSNRRSERKKKLHFRNVRVDDVDMSGTCRVLKHL